MVFLDCIQIVPQIDIFVRSGWANVLAGSWRDAADLGAWWSSSAADTSDRAWRPYIQQSQLNLNTNANRWHGLPLRWFLPRWGADLLICIPPLTSLIQYSGSGGGKRTNGYLDRLKKRRHQDYYQNNMRR